MKVPAALILLAACLPIAAQTRYVVVDLGLLGAPALSTTAVAINNAGQVAGNSTGALNAYYRAYRTSPDKPINPATDIIPAFSSGTYSQVYFNAINNSGQVAGFADQAPGVEHAFRLDANNTMRDLGSLGISLDEAVCCGINDFAQVTGNLVVSYSPAPPNPCSKSSIEPAFRTAPYGTIDPDDYLGSLLGAAGMPRVSQSTIWVM
jgi:probable HAF family extracellular repeat protein